MMPIQPAYDVAVVGASIAGCTAATLFARQGLRVALIERHPDPDAYKVLCTHFIQAEATPVIQRLGLAEALDATGAVRNGLQIWTRWGWIHTTIAERPGQPSYGYNIRRQVLDPILPRATIATPGVEFMPGQTAKRLRADVGRFSGFEIAGRDGQFHTIAARLVVGADGRSSRIAEAEPISKIIGALDMPNISRRATLPGLALVGDAALASDPLWGTGCGWAFRSAEWLVEHTAAVVLDSGDVDRALERYRKEHRRRLLAHYLLNASYSTGRPFNLIQRLLFSVGTKDARTAQRLGEFAAGLIGVGQLLSPESLGRALWANLTSGHSVGTPEEQPSASM